MRARTRISAWVIVAVLACNGKLGPGGPSPRAATPDARTEPPSPLDGLGPLPDGVRRDLLEKDVVAVRTVAGALPADGSVTAPAFLAHLPSTPAPSHRDLGFGVETVAVVLRGGDLDCFIRFLTVADRIGWLEVDCPGYDPVWGKIEPLLSAVKGPLAVGQKPFAYTYSYRDDAVVRAAAARPAAELGEAAPIHEPTPSPAAAAAAETLRTALDLTVGYACGPDGSPPAGRPAMDLLVAEKRDDLLSQALRAPSPEGRVYAALGLRALEQQKVAIRPEDRAAIEKLSGQPTRVHSCNGCISETQTAGALLAPR